MSWKNLRAMAQWVKFTGDSLTGDYSKTEWGREYGIKHPTRDKSIARYVWNG